MNDFTSLLLTYVGIYFGVVLLAVAAINFFMGGAFFPWFKVKISRGKKILVRVRTIVQDYYKPGIIDKGMLVFIDREKEERRLSAVEGSVYRGMGVNNVDVDDETNAVIKRDFTAVSGFDAVKYNYLYLRALFRPENMTKEIRIIIILLVVVLLISAAAAFMAYDNGVKITALSALVNTASTSGASLTSGGV